jgi:hypothetical protein
MKVIVLCWQDNGYGFSASSLIVCQYNIAVNKKYSTQESEETLPWIKTDIKLKAYVRTTGL